jgi:DNA-directed RNA polymerase sigma subunit (sigma70/sigma32)
MDSWWQSHSEAMGLATVRLFKAAAVSVSENLRDAIVRKPWLALELLEELKPREAEVLRLRFGIDDGKRLTLEQIGRRFKRTRERIRQIEAEGLLRLETLSNGGKGLKARYQPSKRSR